MIPFDLIIRDIPAVSLDELFFSDANSAAIHQLVKEYQYKELLQAYELPICHKILLHGHSGCGKTSTALALAKALGKPIIITELSHLISAKIGETSKQIKSLFDKVNREKAILFLDEFDLVATARNTSENDVGEMRRLVNTLLQQIDYLSADAILIAATNLIELLDPAILRRFELKIAFELPTQAELDAYYDAVLAKFPESIKNIERRYQISYAEAKDYIATTMKKAVITEAERRGAVS